MADMATQGQVNKPDLQDIELTSVRMHSLALWRWLYACFPIPSVGVPTPVVAARPMDAYGEFDRMRANPNGPFQYLQQPGVWPANARVPLISFNLLHLAPRPLHSFNLGANRHLGWVSVGSLTNIDQLSSISQTRYPTAWDFAFQVDFWTYRPDDMARYAEQLQEQFKLTNAGNPSVFIRCVYPGGTQLIKTYLQGNLDFPNDGADDKPQTYRLSVTLVMEGWRHDQVVITTPTLWYLSYAIQLGPGDVNSLSEQDLRLRPITNAIVLQRQAQLPPT
jgi:hypothetical protein